MAVPHEPHTLLFSRSLAPDWAPLPLCAVNDGRKRESGPAVTVKPAFDIGHAGIEGDGHDHEGQGARCDEPHVLGVYAPVDDGAQSATPHEGGEDRRPDGGDGGDADSGEDDREGNGEFDRTRRYILVIPMPAATSLMAGLTPLRPRKVL